MQQLHYSERTHLRNAQRSPKEQREQKRMVTNLEECCLDLAVVISVGIADSSCVVASSVAVAA